MEIMSRRFFLAAGSAFTLMPLAGCGSTGGDSADQDQVDASSSSANSTSSSASDSTTSGVSDSATSTAADEVNPYDFDFLTKLKQGKEVCKTESANPGTIEELHYSAHSRVLEEAEGQEVVVDKRILVYLPNGYDPAKSYNILYLLHGTDGDEAYWLGDAEKHAQSTQNLLDAIHDQGLIESTIVACPCYYTWPDYVGSRMMGWDDPHADDWPEAFWQELREDIVPLVETTYSTVANGDVSNENLAATRGGRAFAGLSRGGGASIACGMTHGLDWFGYTGTFSGAWTDYDAFINAVQTTYADYPILFWYNGDGSQDLALESHKEFVTDALEDLSDRLEDGKNYAWIEIPKGVHSYESWSVHLWNALLAFFGA